MSETKKEKLEYILGKKRFSNLKHNSDSLVEKIDDDLLDIIYDRFKNKDKKIKSLRKENDRYSDMRLCTKKGGCKHAIGEITPSVKESEKFDILSTNAFNRLMRAHFIVVEQRKDSKYSIRQDMILFSISTTSGEKAAVEYAKTLGMSKKTFVVHQKYMEEGFIPHIVSCMIAILDDLVADLKISNSVKTANLMYLCDEYLETITGCALSEEATVTVINRMLELYEIVKNNIESMIK